MIWCTTENALDLECLVIGQTQSAMYDDHPCTLATSAAVIRHWPNGARGDWLIGARFSRVRRYQARNDYLANEQLISLEW